MCWLTRLAASGSSPQVEHAHARAQVWLVEDGKVQEYPGYFEDYKDELMKEISAEMDEDEPVGPTKP